MDQIEFFKHFLQEIDLFYKDRYFFTLAEMKTIIASINSVKNKSEIVDIDLTILNIKVNSHRTIMLSTQKEKTKIYIIAEYDELGKPFDKLIITKQFVSDFMNKRNELETQLQKTDDDVFDSAQGFLVFSPTSTWSSTIESIERNAKNISFTKSAVVLKQAHLFNKPLSEQQAQQQVGVPLCMKIAVYRSKTTKQLRHACLFERVWQGYKYQALNCELKSIGSRIKPVEYFEKAPTIPVAAIKEHVQSSISLYAYEGALYYENGEVKDIDILSYIELKPTIYLAYGYCQLSETTSTTFARIIHAEELNENNITEKKLLCEDSRKDEIQQRNEHSFFKTYRFFLNHATKNGRILSKKYGDVLIWMETLKTIYHFSPYDCNRKSHSIYCGLQDAGKTYVAHTFESIRYPFKPILSPDNTSLAGLRGGASQRLVLPDRIIADHQNIGHFSTTNFMVDEVGESIVNPQSPFYQLISTLKASLFSNEITIAKANGGVVPRTATMLLTMNYSSGYKELLRRQCMKHAEIEEKRWLQEHKKDMLSGTETAISLVDDIIISSPTLKDMINQKDIFLTTSLPEDEYFDDEINKLVTKRDAIIYNRTINSFHYQKRREEIDISTSLPEAVMKRLPFCVFGSIIEKTKIDRQREKYISSETTEENVLRNLYIPNLRDVIYDRIKESEKHVDLNVISDTLDFFWEKIKNHHTIEARFGDETARVLFHDILKAIMFYNKETFPSLQSLLLIEKWIILQTNNITTEQARSYVKLQKFIDLKTFFNTKNYEMIVDEFRNK